MTDLPFNLKAALESRPHVFGVRHLSPGASWHLLRLLDELRPEVVLVEGPEDATDWIDQLTLPGAIPPLAILAYTEEAPVRSLMVPFAVYSPEYQALKWADDNGAEARFIDLPSGVFLALQGADDEADSEEADDEESAEAERMANPGPAPVSNRGDIYARWARAAGADDYNAYWENAFEHNRQPGAYHQAAFALGASLRDLDRPGTETRENRLREAHMRRRIQEAIDQGTDPSKIVVVTGAFHTQALLRNPDGRWGPADGQDSRPVLTDAELKKMPRLKASLTIMPYSNLRLSSRSGYGAGNESPRYFGLIWEALRADDLPELPTRPQVGLCSAAGRSSPSCSPGNGLESLPTRFLTDLARLMREEGTFRSPAEVIEAVSLARALAVLRGQTQPTLSCLREAAMTCLGRGEMSVVAEALAQLEVGRDIGQLPEGVSRTAIQDDFYRELKRLKLEKYKSTVAQDLVLDLRENRKAVTEAARWGDLERSRFLHRLAGLGVSFAQFRPQGQEAATWKEGWALRWTPEAEIELVESALKGETVEMAAAHALADDLAGAKIVSDITAVIEKAALCGLPATLENARAALQAFSIDSENLGEMAEAAGPLAAAIKYGDLRRMATGELKPLLAQVFLRAALILEEGCRVNNEAARPLYGHLSRLNSIGREFYETVDDEALVAALTRLANRDDLNPGLSGYGASLLLERGRLSESELELNLCRRLSPGIEADIGAGWFEGLAKRNHYGLLSRQSIWRLLDAYLASLNEDEFSRALLFLRRAFADFSPAEKRSICEILGDLWKITGEQAEDLLAQDLSEDEAAAIESLNDFDFGDL